jgi:asparagine synthase (glutamine-hydrolysing)
MLQPALLEKWNRELALCRLIPELEKHTDSPNPVGQFYFWNRTRREIATSCWGLLNDPCHVLAPYLSREVCDFLSALPAEYFLDHNFHTEAIIRHYPNTRAFPMKPKIFLRKEATGKASRV